MKVMSCALQIRSSSECSNRSIYKYNISKYLNWFIIHSKFINLPDLTYQYRHKDVLIQKQIKLCLYQHHEDWRKDQEILDSNFYPSCRIHRRLFDLHFNYPKLRKIVKERYEFVLDSTFFILLSEKNHLIQVQNQNCLVMSFTSRENKQYV